MYINSIELIGYIRLEYGNIHRFAATFTASVQFIVGTNGAGKSSVLYQLSPLPGEKDDFTKEGKKRILITHNGKKYDLISDFSKEHVHSFIVDGENLNDGGTITVQKELVKKHFGYDNSIHEMVHGLESFVNMSPADRKHWFTYLADADYDYAIKVFNKVKDHLNVMQSGLKLAKQRLVIESSKVISDEEYYQLKAECDTLYSHVQFLISQREKPNGTTQSYIDRFNKLKSQIDLLTTEVYKRLRYAYKNKLTTVDNLVQLKENLKDDLTSTIAHANLFYEEFQHLDKLWNTWKASQLQSIANIEQEIQSALTEIAASVKRLFFKSDDFHDPEVVIASCDHLIQWWPSAEDRLHDNRIHGYSRTLANEILEKISQEKIKLQQLGAVKERAQAIVDHQNNHASDAPLECPKCQHHFKINFDPVKLQQAQDMVKAKENQIEAIKQTIQQLEAQYFDVDNYISAVGVVTSTFKMAAGVTPLLDYLIENNIITNQPDKVMGLLQTFKSDANIRLGVKRNQLRIEAARALMEQTNGLDVSASDIQDRRDRAEREVAECEQRKRNLQLEIENTDKNLRILSTMNDLLSQLKQHETDIHNLATDAVENIRRLECDNLLRELQSSLAVKEQALQASERQLGIIDSVVCQINELTEKIELFKILVKELSPTEGLIAEGIFSFMRKFVADMNRIIKLVWTYPLVIKPCALESAGSLMLNYKFPFIVDKESSSRKDVKFGSSAMKEIFDLVFRVAASKALGLGKLPLVLDEFGKGFDNMHKSSIVHMLGTLVDLDQTDQIFMISHDFSQYTALGTSEICVLHQGNIVLPPGTVFNRHVTIE